MLLWRRRQSFIIRTRVLACLFGPEAGGQRSSASTSNSTGSQIKHNKHQCQRETTKPRLPIGHQTNNKSGGGKMLQSFEEYVFQTHDKKFISPGSSMDLDKKTTTRHLITTNGVCGKTNDDSNGKLLLTLNDHHGGSKNAAEETTTQQQQEHHDVNLDYEEAVKALNLLQSNAEALRSSLHQRRRLNSLQETEKYLLRSGLTLDDLKALSIIHVAGTKGKGSTCALADSILRHYGVKTGFYSSPHLVSLTERIRINGQPISKQKFIHYFWPVYNRLKAQQENETDMPAYFKFLTILCFHVYLAEKVDVAILEVGIGGELDCTNIVPHSKTVGITSLGLEHTNLLGNTLKEIAWQKAGIIKPNCQVYTSVRQPECLEVIKTRASEKNATLHIVPEFEEYFGEDHQQLKNRFNNITLLNGSLALQLAYDWLRQNRNGFYKHYAVNKAILSPEALEGLVNCVWPGRCQVVEFYNYSMHLDGAHTVESMQVCGNWFAHTTRNSRKPKILLFNTTGERDSKNLLSILHNYSHFDMLCFVPNIATTAQNQDTKSVLHSHVEQLKRTQIHLNSWRELCQESETERNGQHQAKTYTTVMSCFEDIRTIYGTQKLDILVTGSIHLLGAVILTLNQLSGELGALEGKLN
ncbi:putative folylpolyglutamate synthase [Musca vetustissima]|uniref:putative folylpolyglutamate synthase n=1 Tax=Musca vetustissima TaxID=27455 RepID=UPI002AB6B3B2|nr:putative folylpolyglutamate synthase [Musca vetustissima]